MEWTLAGKAHRYAPTDDDALWLARAVAREGPPYKGVAWALAQRFAVLKSLRPELYPTIADLVQAYSQPVNPRWFPDGDLHLRYRRSLQSDAERDAADKRAARRVQFAREPWDELPDFAREAAMEALSGEIESPVPRAVHFRASLVRRRGGRKAAYQRAARYAEGRQDLTDVIPVSEGYGPGVNWLFGSPSSATLQMLTSADEPALVDVRPPDPKAFPPPPPGVPDGEGWGWRWCYSPPSSCEPDSAEDEVSEGESKPPKGGLFSSPPVGES